MKSIKLVDAKNRFSEICQSVAETGEPVVVTRRGRPIVRLVSTEPEGSKGASVWDTVAKARAKYGPLNEKLELPARRADRNRPDPLDDPSAR